MFVSTVKPFQLSSYKKKNISEEYQMQLLTSYTCVSSPFVTMAGTVINNKVLICKRDSKGHMNVKGKVVSVNNNRMTLQNLIANFKESIGIDFLILNLEPYFLCTRQKDNSIKIYMTTTPDCLSMFTSPKKMFGDYPETIVTFDTLFKINTKPKSPKTGAEKRVKDTSPTMVEADNTKQKIPDKEPNTSPQTKQESLIANLTGGTDVPDETIIPDIELKEIETLSPIIEVGDGPSDNFKVNIGEPLSDDEFQMLLNNNKGYIELKYGKLDNGIIKFTRQPYEKGTNAQLVELFDYFSFGEYDYVEMSGTVKFAGYKNEKEFIWFAELPEVSAEESSYMIEVTKAMRQFVIYIEKSTK